MIFINEIHIVVCDFHWKLLCQICAYAGITLIHPSDTNSDHRFMFSDIDLPLFVFFVVKNNLFYKMIIWVKHWCNGYQWPNARRMARISIILRNFLEITEKLLIIIDWFGVFIERKCLFIDKMCVASEGRPHVFALMYDNTLKVIDYHAKLLQKTDQG